MHHEGTWDRSNVVHLVYLCLHDCPSEEAASHPEPLPAFRHHDPWCPCCFIPSRANSVSQIQAATPHMSIANKCHLEALMNEAIQN